MNNEFSVIVIGENHFNALGVIRALGEKKIYPNVLLIGNNNSFVKKSKYIKDIEIVKKNEKVIIDNLINRACDKKRNYIIPTGDFAASIIDSNYDILKEKYILPNIDCMQNNINKYMNKFEQYKLAKKFKIKMPKTTLIDLNLKNDKNDIYPCILKPFISCKGEKNDIKICKSYNDYVAAKRELKQKNYTKILLQEYVDFDYEYDIPGCSYDGNVIIDGIIKKINIYPAKRGSTCYGKVISPLPECTDNLKKIFNDLNYNGIFDIELFSKNNIIYLNEINFRNSAISYSLTKANIYIVFDWIMLNEKQYTNNTYKFKEFNFMVEDYEFKSFVKKEINFLTFIKNIFHTKKYIYLNIFDPFPLLFKFIYKMKKNGEKNEK